MTTEFRIDRPGVYRDRSGERVYLWSTLSDGHKQWMEIGTFNAGTAYFTNGQFWSTQGHFAAWDIVAYVSPLPADILQRMREALALAEGDEPQSPTVEQRLRHKCRVCGECPNERGVLHHGRGCYVTHKGGGGCTYVDFEKEPKQ